MIDYKSYFTSESEFLLFADVIVDALIVSEVINGANTIRDSAGRLWKLEKWTQRAFRTAIAYDLMNNTIELGLEYGQDLYFSSYLSDSSTLCQPYQNRVYSLNGTAKPKLEKALWRSGGGLLHPNCRHLIEPWFDKFSELEQDVISNDKIEKAYQQRQEYLRYQNQYRKYKDKAKIARENGIDDSKYKARAREWQRRKNGLPKPNDSAYDIKV